MVYVSSMEEYGVTEDTGAFAGEEELGMIDLKAPRSCYPMGKRMAEHYCHIYYEEFQVPVKIARLAQTFGRGISLRDDRVYMQFARAVFEGRDIVLKTAGKSVGNYCAIELNMMRWRVFLRSCTEGRTEKPIMWSMRPIP